MKQTSALDRRHEHVVAAVVVVVGHRCANGVAGHGVEAARCRHVGERAVVVVAVHGTPRAECRRRPIFSVHEEQVGPAVAVGVEHGDAAAEQLGISLVACGAVVVNEGDPGALGDVDERDRRLSLRGEDCRRAEGDRMNRRLEHPTIRINHRDAETQREETLARSVRRTSAGGAGRPAGE